MKLDHPNINALFSPVRQFRIESFQRYYSWTPNKSGADLFNSFLSRAKDRTRIPKHLGSIYLYKEPMTFGGCEDFSVLDGQQRLTTLQLLFAAIHGRLIELGDTDRGEELRDRFLVNYKHPRDETQQRRVLKVRPRKRQLGEFDSIINPNSASLPGDKDNPVRRMFEYFQERLGTLNADTLFNLQVVIGMTDVIVVEYNDPTTVHDTYADLQKGERLAPSDHVRNFIVSKADQVTKDILESTEDYLDQRGNVSGEDSGLLTRFFRDYLMMDGAKVEDDGIFHQFMIRLPRGCSSERVRELVDDLRGVVDDYLRILRPSEFEKDPEISQELKILDRLEMRTAYPFLLCLFRGYRDGSIDRDTVLRSIRILNNFAIRRWLANVNQDLSSHMPKLFSFARRAPSFIEGLLGHLHNSMEFPDDDTIRKQLKERQLYVSRSNPRLRLLLEALEGYLGGGREPLKFEDSAYQVDHVMPQTLTDEWKTHLGPQYEAVHHHRLHTLGNLTLTGHNQAMGNLGFPRKCQLLKDRLSLNDQITKAAQWTENEILERTDFLTDCVLAIWPWYRNPVETRSYRGEHPETLFIDGDAVSVRTWNDVVRYTIRCYGENSNRGEDFLRKASYRYPDRFGTDGSTMTDAVPVTGTPYFCDEKSSSSTVLIK